MKRTFAQVQEECKEAEKAVWQLQLKAQSDAFEAKKKVEQLQKELKETDDYQRMKEFKELLGDHVYRALFEGSSAMLNLHTLSTSTVRYTVSILCEWRDEAVRNALYEERKRIEEAIEDKDSSK